MDYRRQPLHRDVRALRRLQKEQLFSVLPLEALEAGRGTDEDIMELLAGDSAAMAALTEALEELEFVGTVMLSTGLSPEQIEQLPEQEFQELFEGSKTALGGTAANF